MSQNQALFYFQSQPQLQSVSGGQRVFVRAIETYSTNALALSPLTAGNAVAAPAAIVNAVLTLSVLGTESLRQIPLAVLNRVWTDPAGGAAYTPFVIQPFFLLNMFGIDWTKSYVTTIGAAAGTPFSYLFGVYYEYSTDPKQDA